MREISNEAAVERNDVGPKLSKAARRKTSKRKAKKKAPRRSPSKEAVVETPTPRLAAYNGESIDLFGDDYERVVAAIYGGPTPFHRFSLVELVFFFVLAAFENPPKGEAEIVARMNEIMGTSLTNLKGLSEYVGSSERLRAALRIKGWPIAGGGQ